MYMYVHMPTCQYVSLFKPSYTGFYNCGHEILNPLYSLPMKKEIRGNSTRLKIFI